MQQVHYLTVPYHLNAVQRQALVQWVEVDTDLAARFHTRLIGDIGGVMVKRLLGALIRHTHLPVDQQVVQAVHQLRFGYAFGRLQNERLDPIRWSRIMNMLLNLGGRCLYCRKACYSKGGYRKRAYCCQTQCLYNPWN